MFILEMMKKEKEELSTEYMRSGYAGHVPWSGSGGAWNLRLPGWRPPICDTQRATRRLNKAKYRVTGKGRASMRQHESPGNVVTEGLIRSMFGCVVKHGNRAFLENPSFHKHAYKVVQPRLEIFDLDPALYIRGLVNIDSHIGMCIAT